MHSIVEGGGSPISDAVALEKLGYRVALYLTALLHLFVPQAQALLAHISEQGPHQRSPVGLWRETPPG